MHAIYSFLCRGDSPMSVFNEVYEPLLDENNWYQEMATVNRKGEVTELCPHEDYRERHWLSEKLLALPQEERWEMAVNLANDIVVYEINQAIQYLKPSDERGCVSEENEIKDIDKAVVALREEIAQAATSGAEGWKIGHAGSVLEQVSVLVGPFTTIVNSAYNTVRSMVLNEAEDLNGVTPDDEDATILFVDIHT